MGDHTKTDRDLELFSLDRSRRRGRTRAFKTAAALSGPSPDGVFHQLVDVSTCESEKKLVIT